MLGLCYRCETESQCCTNLCSSNGCCRKGNSNSEGTFSEIFYTLPTPPMAPNNLTLAGWPLPAIAKSTDLALGLPYPGGDFPYLQAPWPAIPIRDHRRRPWPMDRALPQLAEVRHHLALVESEGQ